MAPQDLGWPHRRGPGLELEPQERQGRPALGGLGVDAADALIVKHAGGLRPLEERPVLVGVAEA